MSQRKDTGLNTNPWPKLVDHYIERSYYYSKRAKMTIPPEIVGKCDEDFCITKKLNVVLDLGGTLFVRGDYFGGQNTLVALPRKFLYMINSKEIEIKDKLDEHGGSL